MGEVYAGPGFRTCARTACPWPAVVTLTFDYDTQQAWLDDLWQEPIASGYDLCSVHAGRFKPPRGWSVDDRSVGVPSSDGSPVDVAYEAPEESQENEGEARQAALPEL